MPRLRQYAEQDAYNAFRREIRIQQAFYELNQRELSAQAGIPQSTLSKRLKAPENLTVGELRKLVSVVHPDITTVLGLLGYTSKEIKQFKDER